MGVRVVAGRFWPGVALVALAGCLETKEQDDVRGCFPEVPEVAMQLVNPQVAGPDANGICSIRGEVQRLFRGYFAIGEIVTVSVPCMTGETARAAGFPAFDPAPLRGAAVIEVHTETQGGEVASGQEGYAAVPLPALTEAPVLSDFPVLCS